jgi:hypothetical protein
MLLIRFHGNGKDADEGWLHLPGTGGNDYTLCGLSLDGDMSTVGTCEKVRAPAVTCPGCIAVIRHCRGVRVAPNEPS